MEFRYQKRVQSLNPFAPLALKPFIPVTLSHQGRTVRVLALVDSGADASMFDSSIAELLGIDIKNGLKQHFSGITGEIEGYFHEVVLDVVGLSSPHNLAVAFGELLNVRAILGQADFFQHHRITFERYNGRMEIEPANQKVDE